MENASINTEKDKMRSYSVLNTLYHETRQEIELLNKQICVKDNIIADLKNRLGRHERIYMPLGDKESMVIGPSNSLVESLLKEICKLKQKRDEMEFKASRQAEEIQRLNVKLRELELELGSVRCQPDHEKDQEIQRLRSALEERERAEATRTVLCTSLAEEADKLRSQLRATVKVCQELLARLEREKKGVGQVEEVAEQQNAMETPESSDMSAIKAQVCQLQEENQQLKQRVAYVQSLNTQWQKYDSSREDYIRGLCQRLKESTGQGLMPMMGCVSTGLLQQEISRLNALLEEKITECARLDREVVEIKRQGKERIQTLEQQVLIYTDDFKSERADRERAQGQLEDLKEQISQLKQQLHKQGASRESRESRDVIPMCRVHIGHRISTRRSKDTSEPLVRTPAERQQQPTAAAAAATPNSAWNEYPGVSELQCPQCLAKFNDTEAAEYLNHCEECARL
ncbi:TNFAIP3-interacting protein 2 isoform X2 [Melanotaenia boesemani]|uniref:TNFAIP3-interacting protein 2 isoform X2 n=1 Tax=Melanotaenia boesemani TaxID=1250792 RepID=UPI001C05D930|nr:TNFAIP3-interacting protein 2 isoform X2 [Melanotaenia boesemani]